VPTEGNPLYERRCADASPRGAAFLGALEEAARDGQRRDHVALLRLCASSLDSIRHTANSIRAHHQIGLETMCVAGGQGEAMIVERLN
jgi:hypothetical protein